MPNPSLCTKAWFIPYPNSIKLTCATGRACSALLVPLAVMGRTRPSCSLPHWYEYTYWTFPLPPPKILETPLWCSLLNLRCQFFKVVFDIYLDLDALPHCSSASSLKVASCSLCLLINQVIGQLAKMPHQMSDCYDLWSSLMLAIALASPSINLSYETRPLPIAWDQHYVLYSCSLTFPHRFMPFLFQYIFWAHDIFSCSSTPHSVSLWLLFSHVEDQLHLFFTLCSSMLILPGGTVADLGV